MCDARTELDIPDLQHNLLDLCKLVWATPPNTQVPWLQYLRLKNHCLVCLFFRITFRTFWWFSLENGTDTREKWFACNCFFFSHTTREHKFMLNIKCSVWCTTGTMLLSLWTTSPNIVWTQGTVSTLKRWEKKPTLNPRFFPNILTFDCCLPQNTHTQLKKN